MDSDCKLSDLAVPVTQERNNDMNSSSRPSLINPSPNPTAASTDVSSSLSDQTKLKEVGITIAHEQMQMRLETYNYKISTWDVTSLPVANLN